MKARVTCLKNYNLLAIHLHRTVGKLFTFDDGFGVEGYLS